MICPRCKTSKTDISRLSKIRGALELMRRLSIQNDDGYIIYCQCGWFETLNYLGGWDDWYNEFGKIISRNR